MHIVPSRLLAVEYAAIDQVRRAVSLLVHATGGGRRFRSKNRPAVVAVAGEGEAAAAAEAARGVEEGGCRRRRRQHGRQRALSRGAVGLGRGGRALHMRARARRYGSAARQHILRLRRPTVVWQPAPHHDGDETDEQRQHYVHLCVACANRSTVRSGQFLIVWLRVTTFYDITFFVLTCHSTMFSLWII